MTDAEIRTKALELALKANQTKIAGNYGHITQHIESEINRVAKEFEKYIKGDKE